MRAQSLHGLLLLITGSLALGGCHFLQPDRGAAGASSEIVPRLQFQNVNKPWSVTPVKDGYRFEVRQGDQLPGDGGELKERSEAYEPTKFEWGQTYEISFTMEIAKGPKNSAKWMTLSQLQSTFDPGEQGHSPPFGIYMEGERMHIAMRHSPVEITPPDGFDHIWLYKDRQDIVRGQPYQITIRVRFDRGGMGAVKIWRNGKVLADHQGPFGFNDQKGPYLKIGVYRASAPESYAVTIKGLKIRRAASING